ncbi:MAG: tetratricopeptide repeat protein [Ignavibacteria bacterium]|nr:tetratricopeptide repeat protein [Ignavibacteria bacterium]
MKTIFQSTCLILLLLAVIIACSWTPSEDTGYYRFFSPSLITAQRYEPFNYSSNTLFMGIDYNDYNTPDSLYSQWDFLSELDSVNIDEWREATGEQLSRKELISLVYQLSVLQTDSLLKKIQDPSFVLSSSLAKYQILHYCPKPERVEILTYLLHAKKLETLVNIRDRWQVYVCSPADSMSELIPSNNVVRILQSLRDRAKIPSIKERYIFQIMKHYFYSNRQNECRSYFEQIQDSLKAVKSIYYRCMSYVAGAERNRWDRAYSNYLFSRIYSEFTPMKLEGFYGFKPTEEYDWNSTLDLAQTPAEKAALWHLLGIKHDPLRAMKEIYSLVPESDLLDLLLVRLINTSELKFLPCRDPYDSVVTNFQTKTGKVPAEALEFITKVAQENKTHDPALWELAACYLNFAEHNYKLAQDWLDKVTQRTQQRDRIKEQARILQTLISIESPDGITAQVEASIVDNLKWMSEKLPKASEWQKVASRWEGNSQIYVHYHFHFDGIFDWIRHRMTERYLAQSDSLRALMISDNINVFSPGMIDWIKRIKQFEDSAKHTEYETFLIGICPYSMNDICDFLGTEAFGSDDLYTAEKYFAQGYDYYLKNGIPDKLLRTDPNWEYDEKQGCQKKLWADPFAVHNLDRVYDSADYKQPFLTKLEFVRKMIELQKNIGSSNTTAAENCFRLGNGFYNAGYSGNNRTFFQTRLRYYDVDCSSIPLNAKILDYSKARYYYDRAAQLTQNEEFRAKCYFMAAKCEKVTALLHSRDSSEVENEFQYFGILKKESAQTNYFKEILNECSDFRYFITGKN